MVPCDGLCRLCVLGQVEFSICLEYRRRRRMGRREVDLLGVRDRWQRLDWQDRLGATSRRDRGFRVFVELFRRLIVVDWRI